MPVRPKMVLDYLRYQKNPTPKRIRDRRRLASMQVNGARIEGDSMPRSGAKTKLGALNRKVTDVAARRGKH